MTVATEGQVNTPLGTLRCTVGAAVKVCDQFGSFGGVSRRIADYDFNAIVGVIAAGLGVSDDDVREKVFAAGTVALATPAAEFVFRLSSGGKAPGQVAAKGTDSGNG